MEQTGQHENLPKRWRGRLPESACRGWLQTTPERPWLKTVVVSVGGEGASNARTEDGPTRLSVEAPVMGVEQRGRVVPVVSRANSLRRMNPR